GGAAAQGVVDEVANGGAVSSPGKTVRLPPGLQGLGHRAAASLEVSQDIDGGREATGEAHGGSREGNDPVQLPEQTTCRKGALSKLIEAPVEIPSRGASC